MGFDLLYDFVMGTIDAGELSSEVEAETKEAITIAQVSSDKQDRRSFLSATSNSDQTKKDIFGAMKEPIAARFSIVNLNDLKTHVASSNKFILTSVRRETKEKFQVLYGFDEEWMLSVFGQDVPMYSISGILMNLSGEQDWVGAFHLFYNKFMRASKLVRKNRQVALIYSNRIIRGYPISKIETDNSENETYVQFNINMLVKYDSVI